MKGVDMVLKLLILMLIRHSLLLVLKLEGGCETALYSFKQGQV